MAHSTLGSMANRENEAWITTNNASATKRTSPHQHLEAIFGVQARVFGAYQHISDNTDRYHYN
jgi:hypothetical protein